MPVPSTFQAAVCLNGEAGLTFVPLLHSTTCSRGCNATYANCDYSPSKQHFDDESGMCQEW